MVPTVAPFRASSGRPGPQPCTHCSSHSVFATLVHNPVICLLSPCLLSHFLPSCPPLLCIPVPCPCPHPHLCHLSPHPLWLPLALLGARFLGPTCAVPRMELGLAMCKAGVSWVPGFSSFPNLSGVLTSASLETVLRTPPNPPDIFPLPWGGWTKSHPIHLAYRIPACVWFLQRPLGLSGSSCQACFPGTSPVVVECFCGVGLFAVVSVCVQVRE